MIDGQTRRTHIYVSMQQAGLVCAVNVLPADSLGVQGQRVRPQPDSFWSYYPGDVGILSKRATSWKPQNSRITRDNKDYMTALARGQTREDRPQVTSENNEVFSSRWHQRPPISIYRPGTGKSSSVGNRPPTSTAERGRMPSTSFPENNRPTTAPVTIEKRSRRINTGKGRPVLATRPPPTPPPPPPPAVPYRVPRLVESSGNFDNLTNTTFAGGLKPSIFKGDNHFVHQLCLNTNDNVVDQLNSSRDSFLDSSNGSPSSDTVHTKQQLVEVTGRDRDENKSDNHEHLPNLNTGQCDSNNEPIKLVDDLPSLESPHEELEETDQRTIEQEDDEDILQREKDMDEYSYDLVADPSLTTYDYPDPFSEEYEQVISAQAQFPTTNGNSESNLKDLYRDNKIRPEQNANIKAVFEKCVKLARLQTSTIKWEQRRRQSLITYNRLMKSTTLEASTANLAGNFSAKTTSNNTNTNDKDMRELSDIKRDLRCNECKRITCLGNCASGQNYHLYKRIVSTIPSQSLASRQLSTLNSSSNRCKHGYTTCPISSCRTTTTDLMNSNTMITSLNNTTHNRIRSSRTTFSSGQKSQRASVDLRPRSVRQVAGEMKMKFEQASLSPVVVVPLFEDESRSILSKNSQAKSTNGLLPGKSFRSQRRDSLTMTTSQKIISS